MIFAMNLTRIAGVLLLSTCLSAQVEIEPIKPHIVLETVGPDGWRARLGVTNVGVMLASEQARTVWQPQLAPLLGAWQMMVGDEQAFEAASKRLLDYGGTIRIGILFDEDGPSNVAVMLEADRRTDLAALAKDLRQLIERGVPGEWQAVDLGGKQRELRTKDGTALSAPMLEAGRLILVAGQVDGIARSMGLARHLTSRPLTITKPTPTSPALHIQLDLARLTKIAGVVDLGWREVADALGISDLDQLEFALRAAGPRVELDVSMSLQKAARGMVAAFLPNRQSVSGMLRVLPKQASAWKVGRFDCKALYDGIIAAIGASEIAMNPGSIRKDINEEVGIDVDKDLLGNMTDELLVVGSPFQNFDSREEATWMIAFRIKNDATFRAALLKMAKRAKPFLSVAETVEIDGVEMRRYGNMLNYDLWMAAGNGLFVLAAGRDAEDEVADLLRRAKGQDLAESAEVPAAFADLKRHLPPGHNGLAHADLKSVLAIPSEWWFDIFAEVLPHIARGPAMDPEEAEEHQEQIRKLLEAHNLLKVRTATGFSDSRFHWRLFW